jgi:Uma2 family endonuclease
MGLPKLKTKTSVEDYLEGEKFSSVKHEYIEGEVYGMAGTSNNHSRISINLTTVLANHLRDSPCEPFAGETKVRAAINIFYYPDVLVSCEESEEDSYFRNNPILVIEITSPSTAHIDRREKLFAYERIASVQEYAVVDQHRMNVELHRRQPNGSWITYFLDASDDEIEFQSVGLTLPITEIYRRVRFERNANTNNNDE